MSARTHARTRARTWGKDLFQTARVARIHPRVGFRVRHVARELAARGPAGRRGPPRRASVLGRGPPFSPLPPRGRVALPARVVRSSDVQGGGARMTSTASSESSNVHVRLRGGTLLAYSQLLCGFSACLFVCLSPFERLVLSACLCNSVVRQWIFGTVPRLATGLPRVRTWRKCLCPSKIQNVHVKRDSVSKAAPRFMHLPH